MKSKSKEQTLTNEIQKIPQKTKAFEKEMMKTTPTVDQ